MEIEALPTMDDATNGKSSAIRTTAAGYDVEKSPSQDVYPTHRPPRVVGTEDDGLGSDDLGGQSTIDAVDDSKKGFFAYFKTRDFYIVLVLGYFPPISNSHAFRLSTSPIDSPPAKSSQSASQAPTPFPPCSLTQAPPSLPSRLFSTISSST